MKHTDPWWVCNKCQKSIIKVGSKNGHITMLKHRKVCDKMSMFSIKQRIQTK